MTTGNPAAARAKVVNGTLRHDTTDKTWGGKGSGLLCDACEQAIVATDFEIEADFPDRPPFPIAQRRSLRRDREGREDDPVALTRRRLEAWLTEHGFQRLKGKMSGHVQFEREGVKITVPGHGPPELTKKHVGLIVRALAGAGFDREQLKRDLQ